MQLIIYNYQLCQKNIQAPNFIQLLEIENDLKNFGSVVRVALLDLGFLEFFMVKYLEI